MLSHFVRKAISDFHRERNRNSAIAAPATDYGAHLDAAVGWLMKSIEVCDGRASSKGYRLLKGWMPPYPETSGYIIPTLIALSYDKSDPQYLEAAKTIGHWLVEVQQENGGFAGFELGVGQQPDVFDTGMILLGFNALIHEGETVPFIDSGRAAARFLVASLDERGCFVRNMSHDIVHAYNVRSAWGLLAFAELTQDRGFREAAIACGRWTVAQQNEHGFYLQNNFKPGGNANTHGTAYVMRGLLQMHELVDDRQFLESVICAATKVCSLYEQHGFIAAELGSDWQYVSAHICLTGYAQLAIILYRLGEITGDDRYRQTADRLVADVASYQDIATTNADWRGAIAGSFPIYGRYAPFQYPNWATKFFIDALLGRRFGADGAPPWTAMRRYAG
jgi:hypothetical protein